MTRIFTPEKDLPWLQSLLSDHETADISLEVLESPELAELSGLWISSEGIHLGPAWFDELPGYLFPDFLPASEAVVHALLEILTGAENPHPLPKEDPIRIEFTVFQSLLEGLYLSPSLLETWRANAIPNDPHRIYRMMHNMAMLLHYGDLEQTEDMPSLKECYEAAIEQAPTPSLSAFTSKHFSTLLADVGRPEEAKSYLQNSLGLPLPDQGRIALTLLYNDLLLDTLPFPIPEDQLQNLTESMWTCLQYLEDAGMEAHIAMLLINASRVANLTESFSESLGYINRAVGILEQLDLPQIRGNAFLQKGNLLYTWAQHGAPQFYRPAVESYHEAVKIFTKEHAPQIFATIQHHLAVLYSEMPDEHKKRHIWAAVSVRSFDEALEYFTKKAFPYEYGMICNNYGNALMKFPPARNADHNQMALDYYREALQVRNAEYYPEERSITLLNFLEASWKVGNPDEAFNHDRYQDMVAKTAEVLSLTKNPALLEEANRHQNMLEALIKTTEHA